MFWFPHDPLFSISIDQIFALYLFTYTAYCYPPGIFTCAIFVCNLWHEWIWLSDLQEMIRRHIWCYFGNMYQFIKQVYLSLIWFLFFAVPTNSPGFQHQEYVVGRLVDDDLSSSAERVAPMCRVMHNGTKPDILHCQIQAPSECTQREHKILLEGMDPSVIIRLSHSNKQ